MVYTNFFLYFFIKTNSILSSKPKFFITRFKTTLLSLKLPRFLYCTYWNTGGQNFFKLCLLGYLNYLVPFLPFGTFAMYSRYSGQSWLVASVLHHLTMKEALILCLWLGSTCFTSVWGVKQDNYDTYSGHYLYPILNYLRKP